MRKSVWILALVLLTAPAISGCIGFGGDDGGDEGGNETNDTGENGTGTNDSDTDETSGDYAYENRTGSVPAGLGEAGSGQTEETFTVSEGTSALRLVLSPSGGGLDVCVQAPGSGGNATMAGEQQACSDTFSAEDGGNSTFDASEPATGEWTLIISRSQPGTSAIDYQLSIGTKSSGSLDSGSGNSARALTSP